MKVTLKPSAHYENYYSISYQVEDGLDFTQSEELTNKRISAFVYAGDELVEIVQLINNDYEKALEARKVKQLSIKATIEKLNVLFPLLNVEGVE